MKPWDWVQWEEFVLLSVTIVGGLWLHGDEKSPGQHDFRTTFIALVIASPIIGRIFGWW